MNDSTRTKILEMEKKELVVDCSSIDEHHQHYEELLTDIDQEIWELKSGCCIYRVPNVLRDVNPEAYTPLVVSIGPLHHGKPKLASMEKHKKRYARRFRERVGLEKWKSLETFVKDKKNTISNCYEDVIEFQSHEFEEIVLLDAVFIIEFLWRKYLRDEIDLLQRRSLLRVTILRDLQLLENQLPYFLLRGLYMLALRDHLAPPFLTLCSNYFSSYFPSLKFENLEETLDIKHFIDLLRHAWLIPKVLCDKMTGIVKNFPSATKLQHSGLKFKSSTNELESMLDIKLVKKKQLIPLFEVDEIHMPLFDIADDTECCIRNLMALEQCHYPHDKYFCNFIDLLNYLIVTKEDVELLVEKGVILNLCGDPKALADMVNKLMKNIYVTESHYFHIVQNLQTHYHSRWNRTKATLVNVYFSNLWGGTATIVAVILLLLTLIQTICSILQVIYT